MTHTHPGTHLSTALDTKHRAALSGPEVRPRLWECLGGGARGQGFEVRATVRCG